MIKYLLMLIINLGNTSMYQLIYYVLAEQFAYSGEGGFFNTVYNSVNLF